MTKEEARAVLIEAFANTPDLPDDMKMVLAKLINPSPRKKRWWKR